MNIVFIIFTLAVVAIAVIEGINMTTNRKVADYMGTIAQYEQATLQLSSRLQENERMYQKNYSSICAARDTYLREAIKLGFKVSEFCDTLHEEELPEQQEQMLSALVDEKFSTNADGALITKEGNFVTGDDIRQLWGTVLKRFTIIEAMNNHGTEN